MISSVLFRRPKFLELFFLMGFLSLISISQIDCKIIRKNIDLNEFKDSKNRSVYLTKFVMDTGRGEFNVKARLVNPIERKGRTLQRLPFILSVLTEEQWARVQEAETCNRISYMSREQIYLLLNTDSQFNKPNSRYLNAQSRPHVWYFLLLDCNEHSENVDLNQIEINLEIWNPEGSQLQSDEKISLYFTFIILLVFSAVFLKKNSSEYRILLSQTCIGVWILSHFLYLINGFIYSYLGSSFLILEFFSQILSHTCGLLIMCTFVLLSQGWTIRQINVDFFEVFVPSVYIIGLAQILIIGIGKISDDSPTKFHEFDGFAGYLMMFIRAVIGVYFAVTVISDSRNSSIPFNRIDVSDKRYQLQVFQKNLQVGGISYFLGLLLVFILSLVCPLHFSFTIFKFGITITESIAQLIFHYIFTNKRTQYYTISETGSSLLPSAKIFDE